MNFTQKVLSLTSRIPRGKVTTYKAIAEKLNTRAYRAVGTALNKNKNGAWQQAGKRICRRHHAVIPCHRVINSDGNLGGYAHGLKKKIHLLREEGIEIKDNKINLKRYFFKL